MPNMITTDETAAFDQGVAVADAYGDTTQAAKRLEEEALVSAWFERLDVAREHDRDAYRQLGIDRAYARGDSLFQVKVNVIGSYIDTWCSLLYAQDPEIDALPADQVGDEGLEEARQVGETAMIIISKQWRKARLKTQARVWVRAALTSKVGWLKATWQERAGFDPTTARAIADLEENLDRAEKLREELADDEVGLAENDRKREELRLSIAGLQGRTEQASSKGWAIDPVDMADITVSDECPSIERYLESPWISHRTYMRISQGKATYKRLTKDDWAKAAQFSPKKPKPQVGMSPNANLDSFTHEDAESYITAEIKASGSGGFVCVEEIWDRDTNQVITLIKGVKRYAVEPYAPNPGTSRFYPFFGLTFTEVDGQRWAQSLNERSQSLQDAYDRAYSAFETARRRAKPKTFFNASLMDPEDLRKITDAEEQEMVPIKPTNPKQNMRDLIFPIVYGQIDGALYDTRIIMEKFELIWGLQEALSGSIAVAKTATEAELQQGGTQARTNNKRDLVEDGLGDLAQYMFEVDVQKMTYEDAVALAGQGALWLEGLGPEDFEKLTMIQVRAGSSGKPNNKAQRESWAQTLPIIQGLTTQIGQLRMSSPIDMADAIEELLVETVARSGENIDVARFTPKAGEPMMLIDPNTMQPVLAYPAPQQPGLPGAPAPGGAPAPSAPPMPEDGMVS